MGALVAIGPLGQKIVPVPHGLHQQKRPVEHQGDRGDKDELSGTVGRAGTGGRVIGQNEGQNGDGRKRGQGGGGALEGEDLLPVAPSAKQQAQADDAGQNEHDRGKYRIPGQGRGLFAAGQHERDDQRDFDDGDGHRQHQGAERFAHPMRHHLGMMHPGHHAPEQAEEKQRGKETAETEPGRADQQPSHDRGRHGPFGKRRYGFHAYHLRHGRIFSKTLRLATGDLRLSLLPV